jgi:hypothetical protein
MQKITFTGPSGEKIQIEALFDEGAMISAMCTKTFKWVKHRLTNWEPSTKQLRMANGTIIPSKATWKGEVIIKGIKTRGEFKVFDSGGGWKFLLGKPLLQAFKAVHEYETDIVHITRDGGAATIHNQNHTEQTEMIINKTQENSQTWDSIPTNLTEAATFTRTTDPRNLKQVTYIVKAVQYGETLTLEERKKVKDLVSRYADIFTCSLSEVLLVPWAQHRLNIPEGSTFNLHVHQQALTPLQTQFLHGRINEMLAAGIIEKAPAELVKCCATTVLAQKAHEQGGLTLEELQRRVNEQCAQQGQSPAFTLLQREVEETPKEDQMAWAQKWRICQNFNEVNRHTVITLMLQGDIWAKHLRLSGHKYISVFDFASGFYAVEIPEDSRPFTAFYVEGRGYFWYKWMPMGLTGAPTTFCEMMATHLHDLIADMTMELFVDDGGSAGDTFEEMLEKLEQIFQQYREQKLSLSPMKCQLFMTETTFTGATVRPAGVQPDLEKLTAIVKWERPADTI